MEIFSKILGNIYHNKEWRERAESADIEIVNLDQWTAQKSRFLAIGNKGNEYPIALTRHSHISNGDIIYYSPTSNKMAVLQVELSQVLVIDLSALASMDTDTIIHTAVELGHALGNQHWPAVVKGTNIYVPLTVDKKVMTSVMDTHHIENISYKFLPGKEIIPYLAPHEIRRLFGGTSHENHSHEHYHDPTFT